MSLDNTPRLYVGTYAKYNNGSIGGAWLDLDDYDDAEAFYKACQELHADESDPEYMFQDFEGFPRELYSESGNVDGIYEYIDFCRDSYLDQDVIDAGLDLGIPLEKIEDAYCGSAESHADFAEEWADQCGLLDGIKDSPLAFCIDWEHFWNGSLSFDIDECGGHYFYSNY